MQRRGAAGIGEGMGVFTESFLATWGAIAIALAALSLGLTAFALWSTRDLD